MPGRGRRRWRPSGCTRACTPVSPVAAPSGMMPGMRYLFVGDSMTIGAAGDFTWRYRFWRHLTTLGEPFGVVGPRDALYDRAADAAVSADYADPAFPPYA